MAGHDGTQKIPLKEIKIGPLANEHVISEEAHAKPGVRRLIEYLAFNRKELTCLNCRRYVAL
jgi:hypothetical protein